MTSVHKPPALSEHQLVNHFLGLPGMSVRPVTLKSCHFNVWLTYLQKDHKQTDQIISCHMPIKHNIMTINYLMISESSLCSKELRPVRVWTKNIWRCPGVSVTGMLSVDPLWVVGWGLCGRGLPPAVAFRSHQIAVCGVWRPNEALRLSAVLFEYFLKTF